MNWLRIKLRAWLGIKDFDSPSLAQFDALLAVIRSIQESRDKLQKELDEFKAALKARAAQSERKVPRPWDYESAQVAQLQEFEEKPNGVR